jgi:preprotein translocase subunit SecA
MDLKDDKLEFFIYQIDELFGLTLDKKELVDLEEDELLELVKPTLTEFLASLTELLEDETVKNQVRNIMIKTLDQMWLEHMERIESLKEGIHLRGYAQEDPYRLFTMEGFELFNESMTSFQYNMATKVFAFKKSVEKEDE